MLIGWKGIVRRILGLILLLVFLIAALVAALVAPYFFAAWSANIFLLTVIAVASFGMLIWIGIKSASAIATLPCTRRAITCPGQMWWTIAIHFQI